MDRYAWAAGGTVACMLAGFAMRSRFDLVNVAMVYLLAVVIIALRLSRGPAIAVSVLCVVAFDALAVMASASSSLEQSGERLTAPERRALAKSIFDQAWEMSEHVTKVLQMTRLKMSAIKLDRDWASLGEIVGAVLARRIFGARAASIRSPTPNRHNLACRLLTLRSTRCGPRPRWPGAARVLGLTTCNCWRN